MNNIARLLSVGVLILAVSIPFPVLGKAPPDPSSAGKQIFRFETFGDETFWGDALRLHEAIAGAANGGVGPGLSPNALLIDFGFKIDVGALPRKIQTAIRKNKLNLNDPAVTLQLLQLNAVVGLKGVFNNSGRIVSLGFQCALCHSTVDNSFAPGIGQRLDFWANRDLNIGDFIANAPDLKPFVDVLKVADPNADSLAAQSMLRSWGPGKFDAEFFLDGVIVNPTTLKSSATLIPSLFGLSGLNLSTWTGWGSVSYANVFMAVPVMHGQGTFVDSRLQDAVKFPIAVLGGLDEVRSNPDLVTPDLAQLCLYQTIVTAPAPPAGSFNSTKAAAGQEVFNGKGTCASCHVPPLFSDTGWNMHTPVEMGIEAFQANRAPDGRYATPPLKAVFTHAKGGFFHDGRFATLRDVVDHFDGTLPLGLTEEQKDNLVHYLESL